MAEVTIFHNPRCSKSRAAMTEIEDGDVDAEVVRYLDDAPDRATLEDVVAKLEDPVEQLVRTGDRSFEDLGIDGSTLTDAAAVIDLLVEHPEVMERPVLVKGDRAIIGRPTERVAPFLEG